MQKEHGVSLLIRRYVASGSTPRFNQLNPVTIVVAKLSRSLNFQRDEVELRFETVAKNIFRVSLMHYLSHTDTTIARAPVKQRGSEAAPAWCAPPGSCHIPACRPSTSHLPIRHETLAEGYCGIIRTFRLYSTKSFEKDFLRMGGWLGQTSYFKYRIHCATIVT